MSMEMHVFYRGKLPTKTALNRAMKELGLPLTITEAARPLEQQTGFMPMRWRGEDTGVEFDVWSDPQSIREIGAEGVDPSFDRTANFRWGGDFVELLAAQSVAAAIVKLTGGIVFDPEDGRLLSYEEVVGGARETLQHLKANEKPKVRTARVSDLKHHLEPILDVRSDLVLRGRLLIMKPVRHFIRGAWFDRTSDKYTLKVGRFITPLYDAVGYDADVTHLHVWEPYFQSLLLDLLQEQVFEHVGSVTDISSYARYLSDRRTEPDVPFSSGYDPKSRVTAHLLAGEKDRAEDVLRFEETESRYDRRTLEEARMLLTRDIESFSAHHHAHEANWDQTETLRGLLQPAPFPIELPIAERHTVADVPFAPTPWPSLPDGFFEPAPERPGDVAFARNSTKRKGQIVMVSPLTREQAQIMHDNFEGYRLFARLAGGELLVLERSMRWSPHNPERSKKPDEKPDDHYLLTVHSSFITLYARFTEREKTTLCLDGLEVSGRRSWSASTSFWTSKDSVAEISAYDESKRDRDGRLPPKTWPITEREATLCKRPLPTFSEYENILAWAEAYLEFIGYGRFTKQDA